MYSEDGFVAVSRLHDEIEGSVALASVMQVCAFIRLRTRALSVQSDVQSMTPVRAVADLPVPAPSPATHVTGPRTLAGRRTHALPQQHWGAWILVCLTKVADVFAVIRPSPRLW